MLRWTEQESNLRHPRCKRGALPTELSAQASRALRPGPRRCGVWPGSPCTMPGLATTTERWQNPRCQVWGRSGIEPAIDKGFQPSGVTIPPSAPNATPLHASAAPNAESVEPSSDVSSAGVRPGIRGARCTSGHGGTRTHAQHKRGHYSAPHRPWKRASLATIGPFGASATM